jgi:hypothetical protein
MEATLPASSYATLPVLLGAGAGFLLAVLWFDLMFDVQARRLDGPDGDARLASIADYYRRVTIEAFPANRLVATVMLGTIAGSLVQLRRVPSWSSFASVLLILCPVALAGWRVVPNAMRLGARGDGLAMQRALARRILWDHLACFVCVLAFLVLQVW